MNIRVAQSAPSFEAEAYLRGNAGPSAVSLDAYRDRWLILFFYPRDFTFICPTEIQAFAEFDDEFERAGASVLAASTDSYHSHKAWFESDRRLARVDFPVIADTSHRIAADYGVLLEDGSSARGTFVIDPEGVVRHTTVSDDSVGRSVQETLRVLHALQTGALCPVEGRPGEPTLNELSAATAA